MMSNLIKTDSEYAVWIHNLSERFRQSQLKAAIKVNTEMLHFYWSLGADIVNLQAESRWGDKVLENISQDLQHKLPGIKGFSPTNMNYIKRVYLLYFQLNTIFPQAVGKLSDTENQILPQVEDYLFSIPWGHHRFIIDKCYDNPTKAYFYVQRTIQNNWSRSVLLNFINTDLYEREGKAITNFNALLPIAQSDLAQEMTKDPYNFDFLSITEDYKEKELKAVLIQNITKFLLELGTGFAYLGQEYRLLIGKTEKFLDMLFYNLNLRCYVVIELKITEFDSAYVGQLGTYITAVNHILKRPEDNPTIGVLICKTKDNVLAQYALEASSQPIGISEYELTRLYPADFKGTLPTIEDIENELKGSFNS
jgi:predicted nuclease of restriction endonuclease-like (RecB) superfamily